MKKLEKGMKVKALEAQGILEDFIIKGKVYEVAGVNEDGLAYIIDEDGDEYILDENDFELDIFELVEDDVNAEVIEYKGVLYKEVKRHAREGELIKVVANTREDKHVADIGDILKVKHVISEERGQIHCGLLLNMDADDYVVLEPVGESSEKAEEYEPKVGDLVFITQPTNGYRGKVLRIRSVDPENNHFPYKMEDHNGNFADIYGKYGFRKATAEEIAESPFAGTLPDNGGKKEEPKRPFKVGDRVRIIADNPRHGWGGVSKGDIGVVRELGDEGFMSVDFPNQKRWNGYDDEFELVSEGNRRRRRGTQGKRVRIVKSFAEGVTGVIVEEALGGIFIKPDAEYAHRAGREDGLIFTFPSHVEDIDEEKADESELDESQVIDYLAELSDADFGRLIRKVAEKKYSS